MMNTPACSSPLPPAADTQEALMQFLYRAPIGLAQMTLDGVVEMINPMSAQLLMPLSADGSLDNLFDVLHAVAPQLRHDALAMPDDCGLICESLRIAVPGAAARPEDPQVLSLSLMKLDARRLMLVLSDATLEAQREQTGLARSLSAASRTDPLTRLPNREAVRELLRAGQHDPIDAKEAVSAVLFINADRFKQINNRLGQAAGDEVLGLMAERLRATLRAGDTIGRTTDEGPTAARVGGDEFVVVINDLRRGQDVHRLAERLLDILGKPYVIGGHQIHCTASLGIVLRPQDAIDPDTLLRDASLAMLEAKRAGGARYVLFEPAMQERAARRSGLEADLHAALQQGQFFIVYQPIVGLQSTGTVDRSVGLEALVRWCHPTQGVVPPGEFIEIAEACGLIGAIGDFVLVQACRRFIAWREQLGENAPRMLSVNLSRAQLADPGFVARVAQILETTGMPPRRLQLEITESLAAQDTTLQIRLRELKALGLTLALDDFGTGYSSLSSLHQFPVDTVKVDRSFVAQADSSHHHRVLIEATVMVASSLSMDTVAEGIETESQADLVRTLGCTKAQGYWFSRPLAEEQVGDWLRPKEMA